jgi:hypothetical protein
VPIDEGFSVRRSSNPIRILGTLLAAVFSLAISGIAQGSGQLPHAPTEGAVTTATPAQEVPPCGPRTQAFTSAGTISKTCQTCLLVPRVPFR